MFRIEPRPYGFLLAFSGNISGEEMQTWMAASRLALQKVHKPFSVLVDMRELKPIAPEAKLIMEEGQRLYRDTGMIRSAVVLETSLVTMQFKKIAKESGIHQWERYISASNNEDWQKVALAWIEEGIDPERE